MEIVFLHILAVIALMAGQAKEPFFKDRIATVPKSDRETNELVPVTPPCKPVFAPTIGPTAGVVMGKVIPG
jgi:hypothetical protein